MNDSIPLQSSTDSEAGQKLAFAMLPCERLDLPDALFDCNAFASQEQADLILPLIVYKQGERFILIDGCKRLLHLRQKNRSAVACAVLTSAPDRHHAALLRIALNRGRALSLREKILFARWLRSQCSEEQYRDEVARLPIASGERFELERLFDCSDALITAVEEGFLDRSVVHDCTYLTDDERDALLAFFKQFAFSRQMQRELLEWLPELSFREQQSIIQLLGATWVREVADDLRMNTPQKIAHLRSVFYARRFPTLVKAKKTWDHLVATLNPDRQHVLFKPSDAFEKNRLELKVTLTSGQQAKELFARMAALDESSWDKLIYPAQLFGEEDQA